MAYNLTFDKIDLISDKINEKISNLQLTQMNKYKEIINKKTINKYLPNVSEKEKMFVNNCYIYLLNYLYEALFENETNFWEQLTSNNNQDIETIFLLLLPFLKNSDTKSVKSINNLFNNTKKVDIKSYESRDLVNVAKNLKYTNKLITLLNQKQEGELIIDYRQIMLVYLEVIILTVRKISHKMMISWHNIFPMKFNSLNLLNNTFHLPNDNKLIKNTLENLNKIKSLSDDKNLNEIIMDPKGLWVGEIYQQIYHRFYTSVISSKYLIYPYSINNQIIYGAEILDKILRAILKKDTIDYTKQYFDYSEEEQKYFEISFNRFKEGELDLEPVTENIITNLLKRLLLYMSLYDDNAATKEEFSKLLFDPITNDLNDDIEQKIDTLRFEMSFFNNLTLERFYQFIYHTIHRFKNTPYFRFLYEKTDKQIRFKKKFNDDILNLKWIYNWAKSSIHYIKNTEFIPMDSSFQTNHKLISKNFFSKLIKSNYEWFNIKSNIIRTFKDDEQIKDLDPTDISLSIHQKMLEEYSYLDNSIPFYLILIFDDMIRNGVLSKFIVNTKLTDKTKQPRNDKKLKKYRENIINKIFEENKYENNYYYWTNEPYKNLEKYSISPKDENKKYFKLLANTFVWATYFSNDWVTQIDFYAHFLHQQIMYVTGATGQGKSTQVPKLTSYGTKAFLYKYDGHIIGTQPRTAPTRGNISWISRELGIPVLKYERIKGYTEKQEVPTDNFYLQFKYQQDKHIKTDNTLKLTMATDGTLLNEVSNSLLLKKKIRINPYTNKILRNNLYEAVMIDEAHEHNANMDLILSIMRQVCYYNPEIRLLIISATMDDDEPLYRSYYSLINDNHCFPFRGLSMNPLFENTFIDTNLYDRRFHISPPGGTTQHQVDEYYLPQNIQGLTLSEASNKVQLASYKVVKDIADKNPTGEILLFLNGQNEIKKAVKNLNKILPKKTIAIPFYTKLHRKFKEIVTSIEKNISNLKVKKELIHEFWGEEYQEDKTVPNNLYDRAVIIATNVAEASITIKRLKFVVDNGYSKENTFDEILGPSLKIQEISESSRIQRRGRVGRIAPGKAYFLYEKGGREDNPPKLKITQTDPISWMGPFIKNPNQVMGRPKIIMTKKEDFHQNIKNIRNIREGRPLNIIKMSVNLSSLQPYHYEGYIKNPPSSYYKSMDEYKNKDLLLDFPANYWIIHPRETNITRNVFYNLIEFNNSPADEIPKEEQKFTNRYLENDKDFLEAEKFIMTSVLSNIISKVEGELEVLKPIATSIVYGDAFGIIPELLLTISIIMSIRSLSNIISKRDLIKLKKYNKYNSDFEFIGEIAIMTLKSSPKISNILNNIKSFQNKLYEEANKLKNIYETKSDSLDLEDRIYLKKLKVTGEWNNKNIVGKIIDKTKYFKKYFKNLGIKVNLPNIFNLRKNPFTEEEISNNFINLFTKFLSLDFKMKMLNTPETIIRLKHVKTGLSKFKHLIKSKLDQIVFCIITGTEKNIVVNLSRDNTLYYKQGLPSENKLIDRNARYYIYANLGFTNIPQTLVTPTTLQHYYSSNLFDGINYLNYISNIPIEWLILLDPVYLKKDFKKIKLQTITNENRQIIITPEISYLGKKNSDKFHLFKVYWQSRIFRDIYANILKSYEEGKK